MPSNSRHDNHHHQLRHVPPPHRCTPIIYAATYFLCMVIVDFTIEGTQNAFPELLALPYAMTLFQFSFCFFLPVAISKGKTLKNLPTTIIGISPYIVLSLVVFSSNVCKSASARYVSFPTKVIFRSTKLIPVMIVASMLNINNQRKYGRLDFLAALMLCAGAAGYSIGEHSLNDDKIDSYFGLLLLAGSVSCDAFTPNIKEWLMNPATTNLGVDDYRRKMPSPTITAPQSSSSLTSSIPDIIISDSSVGGEYKQVITRSLSRKKRRFLDRGGLGLSAITLMTNAYAVGCVGLLVFMALTGHLNDAIAEAIIRPYLFFNLVLIGLSLSTAVFAHTRLIKVSAHTGNELVIPYHYAPTLTPVLHTNLIFILVGVWCGHCGDRNNPSRIRHRLIVLYFIPEGFLHLTRDKCIVGLWWDSLEHLYRVSYSF